MPLATEKVITRNWGRPDSWTLDAYKATGGYAMLEKALGLQPAQIIDEVKKSNLRGRGGAGFPTGMKWSFVPKDSPRPKYLAVNADESEPGTFKDRYILENDPHMLLEGIAIASFGLGVHTAYVYVRGEFKFQADRLQKAIDEAYRAGIFGKKVLGRDFCSTATSSGARARTSAARRPECSSPSRARRAGPGSSLPSPRWWGSSAARRW
jgi:NADH-quinone oxidoreductase subunit F